MKPQENKDSLLTSQIKYRRLNEEYARFSKATKLRTQFERLEVGGFSYKQGNAANKAAKGIEKSAQSGGVLKNELHRRKHDDNRRLSADGRKIIDTPTYNKLTKKFISNGGIIIRGADAEKHLGSSHSASYLPSLNAAFIRDDATVSDVIEEIYHAEQDRKKLFGKELTQEVWLKREIDAQKYLISLGERYKISNEEIEQTLRNLDFYERQLKELLEDCEL